MKPTINDALQKMRTGYWLILRGVTPNREYISHGAAIIWRGCLDLFGLYKYPNIK